MWKIIILSTLFIVAQTTDIDNFYGEWIQVAFYPSSAYIPVCVHYSFAKSTKYLECVYADGTNVTAVELTVRNPNGEVLNGGAIPVLVVNNPDDVMPALNVSCQCGDENSSINGCAAVVRKVNDNYFIMYGKIPESMKSTNSELEQNSAFLYAREVVSEKELYHVMTNIEDLKQRRGAMMCAKENYGTYEKRNEVTIEE